MHAPHQPNHDPAPAKRRLLGRAPRTRSVIAATGLLVLGISSFAVAQTDLSDYVREGARNGTTTDETEIISNIGSVTGPKGGYSTRQSNLSSSGGGAIYGCRSRAGGSAATPRPQNPCLRANNLSTGLAFEFNATHGDIGGLFSVGAGGDSKRPFITNATGVATGLNADRVDGLDAAQIAAAATEAAGKASAVRFVLVNEQGQIEEQSGGFTVRSFNAGNGQNNNVYIDAGNSLVGKGLQATIAIQNRINVTGNADPDPDFSGEIAIARCNTPAVVCAPEGTNNDNTLVVRASNSDGTPTAPTARKRFYVTVTP